ncbi:MAG: stage III sporulation protein AB [Oscillospiraceae bacterium]|nr:stage III sporulation protein AB [Oscillospiraceae bacterium]
MRCAWNDLLSILPIRMRKEVDRLGREELQELRLRLGLPPELILRQKSVVLAAQVNREDLHFCINTASRYSPWAASTVALGYLTTAGGHRIGLCGEAILKNGNMDGIRNVTSVCIRVARDFQDIAGDARLMRESVLIIGPPGSGKTTLLRDLIRQRSDHGSGSVAVVDERGELFPTSGGFPQGRRTDILTGCSKIQGIDIVLRTMGPACIAVDEITAEADCQALQKAGWCGVSLLATAHAASRKDLYNRPVYQTLVKSRLFDTLLILQPDKSWTAERMEQ